MEALLKALKIKWESNEAAELRAFCKGGLWSVEAIRKGTNSTRIGIGEGSNNIPENYITVNFPAGVYEKSMSSFIENLTIDFIIYVADENKQQECIQIRDEFVLVFDDVELSMDKNSRGTAQRMVSMTRQTVGQMQKDPDEGYWLPITYEILFG